MDAGQQTERGDRERQRDRQRRRQSGRQKVVGGEVREWLESLEMAQYADSVVSAGYCFVRDLTGAEKKELASLAADCDFRKPELRCVITFRSVSLSLCLSHTRITHTHCSGHHRRLLHALELLRQQGQHDVQLGVPAQTVRPTTPPRTLRLSPAGVRGAGALTATGRPDGRGETPRGDSPRRVGTQKLLPSGTLPASGVTARARGTESVRGRREGGRASSRRTRSQDGIGGAEGRVLARTLRPVAVGETMEPSSTKVATLQQAQVFEVLEEQMAADGATLRLRMSQGWVSRTSKSGRPLCVDEKAVQRLLSEVPVLQQLAQRERLRVATVLEAEDVATGKAIVREGEPADSVYLVERGRALAQVGGETVARYASGDHFCEQALLAPRVAKTTVVAAGPDGARCLRLRQTAFGDLAAKCPAIGKQQREAQKTLSAQQAKRTMSGQSAAGAQSPQSQRVNTPERPVSGTHRRSASPALSKSSRSASAAGAEALGAQRAKRTVSGKSAAAAASPEPQRVNTPKRAVSGSNRRTHSRPASPARSTSNNTGRSASSAWRNSSAPPPSPRANTLSSVDAWTVPAVDGDTVIKAADDQVTTTLTS